MRIPMRVLSLHAARASRGMQARRRIFTGSMGAASELTKMPDRLLAERLQQDSLRSAKPSRLSQLITVAKSWSTMETIITQQLQKELRIRVAHQIIRLHHVLPPSKGQATLLALHTDVYNQLWQLDEAITNLAHRQAEHRVIIEHFRHLVHSIEGRLATVVETLMDGLKEVMARERHEHPDLNPTSVIVTSEIDRFLQAKIGISLLVGHYLEVTKDFMKEQSGEKPHVQDDSGDHLSTRTDVLPEKRWGSVTENASLKEMVEDACAEVCQLSEHYFQERLPTVEIEEVGGGPIAATIVPSHLHHTLFEILKNAYRATVEAAARRNQNTIPRIDVKIFQGRDENCIRVRDYGDGMSLKVLSNATKYLWTSSMGWQKENHDQQSFQPVTEPMMGMGIGLPTSRLYARHFNGDIRIISIQGSGTDVAIYVSRKDGPERIPTRCFE